MRVGVSVGDEQFEVGKLTKQVRLPSSSRSSPTPRCLEHQIIKLHTQRTAELSVLTLHDISASLSACNALPAVHFLLLVTAISLNSFRLISCIAPPFKARHRTLMGARSCLAPFNWHWHLSSPPNTLLSSVTDKLHRSQAPPTNISLCCNRRLISAARDCVAEDQVVYTALVQRHRLLCHRGFASSRYT